jgi:histone acetyltransferase (RNA polymerase elongator complex component)
MRVRVFVCSSGRLKEGPLLKLLVKRGLRSHSGVLVITVMTSPYPKIGNKEQKFSCRWNCYYCPNEPGQVWRECYENV